VYLARSKLLQLLCRGQTCLPPCRSFLSALLPQLPKLASLIAVPSANSEVNSEDMVTKRMTYLHLLAHLLKLDAQHVLDPSQPSFTFIFDSYCSILTLR